MEGSRHLSRFRGRDRRSLALLVSTAVVCAGVASAQRARLGKTFDEETQVIEVQVPVNVVDRSGEPVRGLTAEQFQLFDGNEPREILDFEVVDLDTLDVGSSRVLAERAVPPPARRHLLLLFDLSFSQPSAIIRARQAAREFVLGELSPTDLVAVAVHTVDSGARLLVTFTPDRSQVARAIDTLGAPRLLQLAQRDPLSFLIDSPERAGIGASTDLGRAQAASENFSNAINAHITIVGKAIARMERSFLRGRVSSWSRAMGDMARFLASVRGRKHVVYFSEGFDGRLLLGRQPSDEPEQQTDRRLLQQGQIGLVDTDQIYGNAGLQTEVAHMLEEFRRADCVIQAVDISGLRSADELGRGARAVDQDALFYIANDTGGELYEDANDFGDQLSGVLKRTAVTYLLTFQANGVVADGSYRPIRVKVDADRKVRLSYRKGYYAPRPFAELHPFEKKLLASDAIATADSADGLAMSVLAAPFRASEGQAYVPIIIEVGGDTLLADHEDEQLPIELYAYVTNELGEMKDFFTQVVTLDLSTSRDDFIEAGFKFYGHLDLTPGEYLVRVLVRNARTGRAGGENLALNIPAFEDREAFVLPPFFVEANRSWVLVREESSVGYQRTVIYPFTVNGNPFIPAALPMLEQDEEVQLCIVGYNLDGGRLEVAARVLGEDGEPVSGGELLMQERTVTGIQGLDKLLATFRPEGLTAGLYKLEVDVKETATGAIESNTTAFVVN